MALQRIGTLTATMKIPLYASDDLTEPFDWWESKRVEADPDNTNVNQVIIRKAEDITYSAVDMADQPLAVAPVPLPE